MWQPCTHHSDPAVRGLHPSFERYRLLLAGIERIATGLRRAEGPVRFGDARRLPAGDRPDERILRRDEEARRRLTRSGRIRNGGR